MKDLINKEWQAIQSAHVHNLCQPHHDGQLTDPSYWRAAANTKTFVHWREWTVFGQHLINWFLCFQLSNHVSVCILIWHRFKMMHCKSWNKKGWTALEIFALKYLLGKTCIKSFSNSANPRKQYNVENSCIMKKTVKHTFGWAHWRRYTFHSHVVAHVIVAHSVWVHAWRCGDAGYCGRKSLVAPSLISDQCRKSAN